MSHARKMLSAEELYGLVHEKFKVIPEPKKLDAPKRQRIPTTSIV